MTTAAGPPLVRGGRFLTDPHGAARRRRRDRHWYHRRPCQLALIVAVAAAAFLTDRYDNYTPTQKQHELESLRSTVDDDLKFCRDGVVVAVRAWQALPADPPAADARRVAAVAAQAEESCTPVSTDGGVYDLAQTEVPPSLPDSGPLSLAVYDLTQWAYPDAARALLAVESLARDPHDGAARQQLATAAAAMAGQRAAADRAFAQAEQAVDLPPASLGLPNA